MSVTSLQITNLFNLISVHFIDNFVRFKSSTLTNWSSYLDSSPYILFNDNKAFTLVNLPSLIEKIFNTHNFLKCGENAIKLVDYIKSNTESPELNWVSQSLKTFCTNSITTNTSSQLSNDSIGNTELSSSNPSSTPTPSVEDNSHYSSMFNSMRTSIQADLEKQMKFYLINSMSKSVKDEHFQELESLLNKQIQLKNSLTTHQQYNNNKVFQKSINSSNFPNPWINDDPIYADEYSKLIESFQTQIQMFNIKHLETKISSFDITLANKLEIIKSFDTNATDKYNILSGQVISKHKASLTKSSEKVNRLITQNTEASSEISNNSQSSSNVVPITNNSNNRSNKNQQNFHSKNRNDKNSNRPNSFNYTSQHPSSFVNNSNIQFHNQPTTQRQNQNQSFNQGYNQNTNFNNYTNSSYIPPTNTYRNRS